MCGRFLLTYDIEAIMDHYHVPPGKVVYRPSPEIYPSQIIPIIYRAASDHHLEMVQWGFPNPFKKGLIINARGETVAEKPMFKKAFSDSRCLIPANGFFEWKNEGKRKVKYRITHQDDRIFSMAGIYQTFSAPDGHALTACVIITTDANPNMAAIHNRMPVILDETDEAEWLNSNDPNGLKTLLKPFDPDGTRLFIRPDVSASELKGLFEDE